MPASLLESGLFADWEVRIFGSDISRKMLQIARRARYGHLAWDVGIDVALDWLPMLLADDRPPLVQVGVDMLVTVRAWTALAARPRLYSWQPRPRAAGSTPRGPPIRHGDHCSDWIACQAARSTRRASASRGTRARPSR